MHHRQFFFCKICLKSTGDTFSQYVICHQGRDEMRHREKWEESIFGWAVTFKRRLRFRSLWMTGESQPQSLSSCKSWSSNKEYPEGWFWYGYCNNFKKNERVFSFKSTNLQHLRLEMGKRWQNPWWCSLYVRFIYPLQRSRYSSIYLGL